MIRFQSSEFFSFLKTFPSLCSVHFSSTPLTPLSVRSFWNWETVMLLEDSIKCVIIEYRSKVSPYLFQELCFHRRVIQIYRTVRLQPQLHWIFLHWMRTESYYEKLNILDSTVPFKWCYFEITWFKAVANKWPFECTQLKAPDFFDYIIRTTSGIVGPK